MRGKKEGWGVEGVFFSIIFSLSKVEGDGEGIGGMGVEGVSGGEGEGQWRHQGLKGVTEKECQKT